MCINWNSLWKSCPFSHLFLYSFIYCYEYGLNNSLFRVGSIIKYYSAYFVSQIVPALTMGDSFRLTPVLFWHIILLFFSNSFFTFCQDKMLQIQLVFSPQVLESATSPKDPVTFIGE